MKYSIITINYNNADGLRRTIESVVSQTYTDYEYLIIEKMRVTSYAYLKITKILFGGLGKIA